MTPKRIPECEKAANDAAQKTVDVVQHHGSVQLANNKRRKTSSSIQHASDAAKTAELGLSGKTLLSLPQEMIDVVLDKIEEPRDLRRLGQTCKRLHELAAPRIHRCLALLGDTDRGVERLIRAIQQHLSISQRRQLRREGQYKSQQHQFPSHVDRDEIPACASLVRQLTIGALPSGDHRRIAQRYLEEGVKHMKNVEALDAGSVSRWKGECIASMKNLKALSMVLDGISIEPIRYLRAFGNVKHLRVVGHPSVRENIRNKVVASILPKVALTLRSLCLETEKYYQGNYLVDRMYLPPVPDPGAGQDRPYLVALESFSVSGLHFDEDFIESLERAIDFMNLRELTIGEASSDVDLLFRLLTRLAALPGTTKTLGKFSCVIASKLDSQRFQSHRFRYPGAALLFQEKIRFLSSINCLTHLGLKQYRLDLYRAVDDPLLSDALLRAIINHGNLTSLNLYCQADVDPDIVPRLSASIVALLINNLPRLKHFEFAPVEEEIEEIGEALSHGTALASVLCCPRSNQSDTVSQGTDSGSIIITGILRGFLSRDVGGAETQFTWEHHYKLNRISLKDRLWDIVSTFGERGGASKDANSVTYHGSKKREVMYREVPRFQELEVAATNDSGSEWMRTVTKDLD